MHRGMRDTPGAPEPGTGTGFPTGRALSSKGTDGVSHAVRPNTISPGQAAGGVKCVAGAREIREDEGGGAVSKGRRERGEAFYGVRGKEGEGRGRPKDPASKSWAG
jgi:hypothetical protein